MFELRSNPDASVKADLLSGLTVALALVPEAVAFAFVAGVEPMVGLYAAFIVGLITALIGGRPGMISGATGALAVVMVALVAEHGIEYLFATVVLMGILQISAGVLKLGKFIRLVPHPVMLGFVNGLAIVIFLAQLNQFKVQNEAGEMVWMQGEMLWTMFGLIGLTMAIIHFLPKLTQAIPSSLVAIVAITVLVHTTGMNTGTVIDFVQTMTANPEASLKGSLPSFHLPMVPLNIETLTIIFPYAIVLAAIGLIESLLTLTLVDELTQSRGHGNRECIGQGVANVTTGFFGGMGGCAMIGQSMININSGGRSRLSGASAALFLLGFILFASSLIEMIPLAALVGVMFIVVLGTFEWSSFRIMKRIPKLDALVIILVSGVTVITDLAVAVMVGVIVSALRFAWDHASHMHAKHHIDPQGWKVYQPEGPLFFASVTSFLDLFDIQNDPQDVVIDFNLSRVADHSAIAAIDTLAERYQRAGKTVHLRHLSLECKNLLSKASTLVEVNVSEDPTYKIATDKLG